MKVRDLKGQRFSYLTVIERVENQGHNVRWRCLCDCGKETTVSAKHLLSGNIKSCGCMHHKYGHGQTDTRLYHIWCTMKARCYRKGCEKYDRYGGRGIVMCDEWREDFMAFYEWSHDHGYDEALSIDRIDNNKGYTPENCRWTTPIVQANNKSTNRLIEYNGVSGTLSQMARRCGQKPVVVWKRLRRGWDVGRALGITGSTGE